MKKLIWLLTLCFVADCYAQDWYRDGDTVCAGGITYNVKVDKYSVILSNTANKLPTDGKLYYKNGSEIVAQDEYEAVFGHSVPGSVERALRNTFTSDEIAPLWDVKESQMSICYLVSPEGDTMEVVFVVNNIPEMLAIPPEKFALLERNLKKYVKWNVSAQGRKVKYIDGWSPVNFWHMLLLPPDNPIFEKVTF